MTWTGNLWREQLAWSIPLRQFTWTVRKWLSYPRPHVDWEVLNIRSTLNQVANVKFVDTDANDDMNTDLPECLTPMSTPMLYIANLSVGSCICEEDML